MGAHGEAPIVAVDLGGTNTRVALVGPDGAVRARETEPTPVWQSHPDDLVALIKQVAQGSRAARAVIGVPGRVDYVDGRAEYLPNLPSHWAEHLTREHLSTVTELDVALANDADLATVGEHRFGAGRGTSDMVYVTLSTGVGCGVILGDHLVYGRRSIAEAGHTVIDRQAGSGLRTFEETASGTAMNRLADRAGLADRGPALVERAMQGDPAATSVWEEVVAAAGAGIANLAHLFSPELIVIGGGLGLSGEFLYEPLRQVLATDGPRNVTVPIRIAPAELGDDAGLIGAAGWALAGPMSRMRSQA